MTTAIIVLRLPRAGRVAPVVLVQTVPQGDADSCSRLLSLKRCCAMQAAPDCRSTAWQAGGADSPQWHRGEKSGSAVLAPFAQQSFLRHGSDQRSVAREDEPASEAAPTGQVRALLCVEQPVVGAERTMQPQRMVETRR